MGLIRAVAVVVTTWVCWTAVLGTGDKMFSANVPGPVIVQGRGLAGVLTCAKTGLSGRQTVLGGGDGCHWNNMQTQVKQWLGLMGLSYH